MSLLVISDLHLAPHTEPRNLQFLTFLEQALVNKDDVVIAGDLFDLWLGWPHLTFPYQERILRGMQDLASRGLRMSYVEGNRDYGIRQRANSIFESVTTSSIKRKVGKRTVFIEHGDMVNSRDKQYRLWHGISKSSLSLLLLRIFPGSWMLSLSSNLETKMKGTNLKYKSQYPLAECERHAREQFRSGADVVIFGHFHEERFAEYDFDGRSVLFYNLPGWEQGFRYLVIPENEEKPYFKEFTKDNGNSTAA
jgi:UDP-2,3-diacylglucosamine hydrolase